MRALSTMIVVGPLMLLGALAPSTQAATASQSTTPIQMAAVNDSATDRDSYSQKAREDMRDWQQKLRDFSEKAEAKGKEADRAAKSDLNEAWRKTEEASRKLQTASAEGWERAKSDYEKASRDLAPILEQDPP